MAELKRGEAPDSQIAACCLLQSYCVVTFLFGLDRRSCPCCSGAAHYEKLSLITDRPLPLIGPADAPWALVHIVP